MLNLQPVVNKFADLHTGSEFRYRSKNVMFMKVKGLVVHSYQVGNNLH